MFIENPIAPVKPGIRFDRLRKVIEAVEAAPEERFDMETWSCGTTACAIGHYCLANRHAELWLDLDFTGIGIPMLGTLDSYRAVEALFGISCDQAEEIFSPLKYTSGARRSHVIARIRQFIADNEPVPAPVKPKMTLAYALREAARRIEAGEVRYWFEHMGECNCGVLAQVVTGETAEQIELKTDQWEGIWGDVRDSKLATCPVTNLPIGSIIRSLREIGLSGQDLHDLENLENKAVRIRAGLSISDFREQPSAVIRYMRAWADLIDAEPQTTGLTMKQTTGFEFSQRAALAHDRFMFADVSDPRASRALDRLTSDIAKADASEQPSDAEQVEYDVVNVGDPYDQQ